MSILIKTWLSNEDTILHIQLSDPDHLNALSVEMGKQLTQVLKTIEDNTLIRCVIISGSGRAFSAGGDLGFLHERTQDTAINNQKIMLNFYNLFLSIRRLSIPTIAAVNGHAIGAGLCFALACDLAIISKTAKIGATFTALGLHPGMGATHFFPLLMSPMQAKWFLLTGKTITGKEATEKGMFLESYSEENLLMEAKKLAIIICENAPLAVRATLGNIKINENVGLESALLREASAQSYSYMSKDLVVGLKAIAGKVKPVFSGE